MRSKWARGGTGRGELLPELACRRGLMIRKVGDDDVGLVRRSNVARASNVCSATVHSECC
jgi:hypothetical protein